MQAQAEGDTLPNQTTQFNDIYRQFRIRDCLSAKISPHSCSQAEHSISYRGDQTLQQGIRVEDLSVV